MLRSSSRAYLARAQPYRRSLQGHSSRPCQGRRYRSSDINVTAVVESCSQDACINLAYEHHLFEQEHEFPFLYLYRNRPAVVIGRNQNPWLECDPARLEGSGVQLVRRFSGGGAVYHDLGNVNYTLFVHREHFDRTSAINAICAALRSSCGLDVSVNQRHDLVVEKTGSKYKCSGSAFKISKDRAYAHGTMLLSSKLDAVRGVLRPHPNAAAHISARGVESIRSRVANLHISLEDFRAAVLLAFGANRISTVDEQTILATPGVSAVAASLKTWDWTFGQTPGFEYVHADHRVQVRSGRIVDIGVVCEGEDSDSCAVELLNQPFSMQLVAEVLGNRGGRSW